MNSLTSIIISKEKARLRFSLGCVLPFFPLVQRFLGLPRNLNKTGVDFTLLVERSVLWFPLIGAGMKRKPMFSFSIICRCERKRCGKGGLCLPLLLSHLMEEYKTECRDLSLHPIHQENWFDEGKIAFKEKKIKVTYHDPCDLGRASGVYEAQEKSCAPFLVWSWWRWQRNREQCKCLRWRRQSRNGVIRNFQQPWLKRRSTRSRQRSGYG